MGILSAGELSGVNCPGGNLLVTVQYRVLVRGFAYSVWCHSDPAKERHSSRMFLADNHKTIDCSPDHSTIKTDEIHRLNLSSLLLYYNKRHKIYYISPKFNPILKLHNHITRYGNKLQVRRFKSSKFKIYLCIKV